MIYITYSLLYLLCGLIWKDFLENFTTNNLEGRLGQPFSLREIISQTLLWPVFLLVFIVEFLRNLR